MQARVSAEIAALLKAPCAVLGDFVDARCGCMAITASLLSR